MKKIILFTVLILSIFVGNIVSQSIPTLEDNSVQEVKVLPQSSLFCCCDPQAFPATLMGQIVTNDIVPIHTVTVRIVQVEVSVNGATVIGEKRVLVNRFGYYTAQLQPCYSYIIIPEVRKAAKGTTYIFDHQNVFIQKVDTMETYVQNFVLIDTLTF